VFRLTRTSLHQLTDLSKYATTPLLPCPSKMISDHSSSVDNRERSSTQTRTSRPLAKFNPTIREGENRHHSLVSMRTFYAFGARSASVSSPSTYRSCSFISQGQTYASPLSSPFLAARATSYLPRSSTSSSVHDSGQYGSRWYQTHSYWPQSSGWNYRTNRPKYSSSDVHISLVARQLNPTRRSRSPVPLANYTPSIKSPVDHFDLSDVERKHTVRHNPLTAVPAVSAVEDANKHMTVREQHRNLDHPSASKVTETSVVKNEMTAENLAELTTLRELNKLLAAEVQQLTTLLREKERNEQDLKRKILESEAEATVWRKKYEMQKPTIIEIRENDGGIDLSADLIDQLDSAAEKLSRFNAVKDLKQLQNEMETALKEIRDK
uniref:Uncharacterized protein n=1 Tax=Parascaris univalens TaxID=6257 RepID=A0A915CAR2_PARUN